MGKTSIEWTRGDDGSLGETWNPVRGCVKVSQGCRNCYAETFAERWRGVPGHPYEQGFDLRLVPEKLDEPLRWKKPRRVFVNSMSDLFHDGVDDAYLDRIFAVMALAPQHTFQVLTKRPDRMRDYLGAPGRRSEIAAACDSIAFDCETKPGFGRGLPPNCEPTDDDGWHYRIKFAWPLPNVWLGVSTENQQTADERIPLLLQTPAAVRFVSAEPLVEDLGDIGQWLRATKTIHCCADVEGMLRNRSFDGLIHDDGRPMTRREAEDALYAIHASGVKYISLGGCEGFDPQEGCPGHPNPKLDLVIVGGESGPGARPMEIAWARSIQAQCKAAGVSYFLKQIGAHPIVDQSECNVDGWGAHLSFVSRGDGLADVIGLRDKKGGDLSEFPESLCVRELPR